MTACIVITRDRVTYTRACITSLEQHPELDIHIVDHGSSWPPMLDYLKTSPHPVHYAGSRPPRDLWHPTGLLTAIVGQHARYLVTDPDIVLDAPPDWLDQLHRELDQGDVVKVGLGLRLDDLPDTELTGKIRMWEEAFWRQRRPSGAWAAPVDTTLALHPPLATQPGFQLVPAARLDQPYLVRHIPWYDNPSLPDEAAPSDEAVYYRDRALPGSTHWANGGW